MAFIQNADSRLPNLGRLFFYVLCLATLPILLYNCAQVAQPPGGKKDTLAPKLVASTPANRQKNFKGKQIELFFNEYIQVENLNQKTIITPGTGNTFTFKLNPTSILLKFNESFKDSTTYTISFTNGIRDASERNPASNLKLVFSTGPQLDSLRITGKVTDINSGTTVTDALVGLYAPKDTLDATRQKPTYYSKTDTSGNFAIENVKEGTYELLTIRDGNSNFSFNPQNEKIGFSEKQIVLRKNIENINVSLFGQNNVPVRVSRSEPRFDSYSLQLDKGIVQYSIMYRKPTDSLPSALLSPTQIKFFRPVTAADTLPVTIITTDSIGTTTVIKQRLNFRVKNKRDKSEPFSYLASPQPPDEVESKFIWKLKFSKPVDQVNSDSIRISVDSSKTDQFKTEAITWNDRRNEFSYAFNTKARKFVQIKLGRTAFISVLGDTIAPVTYTYKIIDPEKYGLIRGQVLTEQTGYFLELLNEQGQVADRIDNKQTYEFRNIKPGKYRLRLTIDINKNGKWDTGDYQTKRAPEPIVYYPIPMIVRQNFESENINIEYWKGQFKRKNV